jgi:hypothetical protein
MRSPCSAAERPVKPGVRLTFPDQRIACMYSSPPIRSTKAASAGAEYGPRAGTRATGFCLGAAALSSGSLNQGQSPNSRGAVVNPPSGLGALEDDSAIYTAPRSDKGGAS